MQPTNFCGGPDTVVEQIKRCREEAGAGVVDLMFQTPDSDDPGMLMHSLALFGTKVLPHIRDV
jgi:alkanesulfonate monooxygenase SsuD/methylene tetrahydromethanopterin reductase-like flavin-dependent oxidoreductase (luciferase family)